MYLNIADYQIHITSYYFLITATHIINIFSITEFLCTMQYFQTIKIILEIKVMGQHKQYADIRQSFLQPSTILYRFGFGKLVHFSIMPKGVLRQRYNRYFQNVLRYVEFLCRFLISLCEHAIFCPRSTLHKEQLIEFTCNYIVNYFNFR